MAGLVAAAGTRTVERDRAKTLVRVALLAGVLIVLGVVSLGALAPVRTRTRTVTVTVTVPPVKVPARVQPKPFDPRLPIDLSGVAGVSLAEQARAENLLAATLVDTKKFLHPSAAIAAGYRSIGDAVTGDEHFVNWSLVDDGHILDPTQPESLVYEVRNGTQTLVAAMYMMPFGSRFSSVPDVGGRLTQWHVHRDICLTTDPVQKFVAGITSENGVCPAGTTKAGNTPMLHVWTVPNACGPFAALEGIGGGQVPAGQERLCDTAHGESSTGG
jgi:hypothetical protein